MASTLIGSTRIPWRETMKPRRRPDSTQKKHTYEDSSGCNRIDNERKSLGDD
jgi:hypothetical protein